MIIKWCQLIIFLVIPSLFAQDIQELTPRLIDHGDVKMGLMVEDTIRLVNTGADNLVISRLKSTCGCTATSAGPMTIAPGDTAVIPYFFNTRGFKGVVRKTIKVCFNNREPAELPYTFQINVVQEVAVDPKYFYLPCLEVNPDTTIVRIFRIGNFAEKSITINDIQTDIKQLSVYPASLTLKPGKWYTFKIHFKPYDLQDGNWPILLHTDYLPLPEIKVPFYVTFLE